MNECSECNPENMANRPPDPLRLIVASSRAPHLSVVLETVHNNVKVVQYKYETCTLDDILGKTVQDKKFSEVILKLYHTNYSSNSLLLSHSFVHMESSRNILKFPEHF